MVLRSGLISQTFHDASETLHVMARRPTMGSVVMTCVQLRGLSFALAISLACPIPSFGFDTELSDTAVREAYFLGQRHDDKSRTFLAGYSRHLPLPKNGPYVSEIRLLTPLAQVVETSSQQTAGYSAQQGLLDYRGRGDSLLLEIHIEFTPTYSANDAAGKKGITLRHEDFWRDLHYGIRQKDEWVQSHSMRGEPIYYASSDA